MKCVLDETYQREYLRGVLELDGDEAGRRAAWKRMGQGSAFYRGEPVAFSFVPRVFNGEARERFGDIARTTYHILSKVIARYVEDSAYRKEFRFDPRVEELVLLPNGYDEPLPVARIDFVCDGETGDFRFIEFNTDSSSGMNEANEALVSVRESESYQRFAAIREIEDDSERQIDGWVQDFLRLYRGSERAVRLAHERGAEAAALDRPRVAIVACFDNPNPHIGELETFRQAFEQAGCPCSVFDVRQLDFDGERLIGRKALSGDCDVEIDCIWRFCIVVDLLEHWSEVQPFVEALRCEKVTMFGGFSTQIAHDKQLFAVLRHPATQEFLTDEERAFVEQHVPFTAFLDDPALDIDAIKANPAQWVLKPTDWYASINVVTGVSCDPDEWARLVDECAQGNGPSPYLIQEFCPAPKQDVVPMYGDEGDFTAEPQLFGEILGAYVYAGDFAGVYVRQGPRNVIGSSNRGLVAPVLWVKG